MLLIDDHEAELRELNVLLDQRMRPDGHRHQPAAQHFFDLLFLACRRRSREQRHRIPDLLQQRPQRKHMLLRQNFRGRENRHLIAVLQRDHRRFRRHDGFSAAHIALQQPVHRTRPRHVVRDLLQHALLRIRRFERQQLLDLFAHPIVQRESDAQASPGPAAV